MLDILVVDDEPSILLPLAGVLRSEGHQVATASDGVSAMSALTAHAFDVVICDVRMQKMDGFAVCRAIQAATAVPPDPPTMQAIARTTGGKSYTAQSSAKLSSVYSTLGSSIGRRTDLREITSWFVAAAALFLLASLAVGRAWEGRLP